MRVSWAGTAVQVGLQALVALALAAGASYLLRLAGTMAMLTALLVLFTLLFFAVLTLLRVAAVQRFGRFGRGPRPRGPRPRGPRPRPPWRGPGDLGGTREPRRPFPPGMPPREVAAEPDATSG
jgi:hypothetical protein